jgi:hypothetical protein
MESLYLRWGVDFQLLREDEDYASHSQLDYSKELSIRSDSTLRESTSKQPSVSFPPSFDLMSLQGIPTFPSTHLTRRRVRFSKQSITLLLPASKSDPFHLGAHIRLAANSESHSATHKYSNCY